MSVAAPATAAAPDDPPVDDPAPRRTRRVRRGDLLFTLIALALGTYVTQGLWADPAGRALAVNVGDQAFFEWLLGYGVYLLQYGADPFFTDLLNTPVGVNLAANTSITVYIVAFAPLTMLAGPEVSFVTILTLNLAGGAIAWYAFFLRWVTGQRLAAAVAGMFCGFAPGFVSHANGHLNWSAGWVAPVVVWWVLKLREPGRWLRNGVVLGVMVTIGFSVAAEGLFFTALASGLFLAVWSLSRATRAEARAALSTVLRGLGVTAVAAGTLLAYPLYMHFAGPQTFVGTGFNQRHYVEDVLAYVGYADLSLAAWAGLGSGDLASNQTEQASFFGFPLIVLIVIALAFLWRGATGGRRATLRALIIVSIVFMVLSWGPRLRILGSETPVMLPYAALARLPLFDAALPTRYALVVVGVFGVILAMTVDRLLTDRSVTSGVQTAYAAGFALALVPLVPLPLTVAIRAPEPAFVRDRIWERYVPDGGTISALPMANNNSADSQRWQAYTMARGGKQFRIPDGYFLGPGGEDGTGRIGAPWRNTDWLFARASRYGYVTPITDADKQAARRDFAYWNIQAVFLADEITGAQGPDYRAAVEITATGLLGPPERVGGVLVWRIRPGVDPVSTGG